MLGICYGMQLLVQRLGGEVEAADKAEYGRMPVHTVNGSLLFKDDRRPAAGVDVPRRRSVEALPTGFPCVGKSDAGAVVAIENAERKIFGLQYHPEVTHSERGFETIKRFLFDVAGLTAGWSMQNVLDEQIALAKETVGPDAHVICALSGGVDSAVAATLVHKAIGDRLHCCFVDNGLLRYKEQERVMKMFKDHLHLPGDVHRRLGAPLGQAQGRDGSGEEAQDHRRAVHRGVQGVQGGRGEEDGRAAHVPGAGHPLPRRHRVLPPPGIGPEASPHHQVAPQRRRPPQGARVRARRAPPHALQGRGAQARSPHGRAEAFISRHPFPGARPRVRVLGDVTAEGALDVIRAVDEIYINAIKAAGLYDKIWQAFAVFLPIKSVGVQGDQRTHSHVVGLRAITSSDGMTADWFQFEPKFLQEVSAKICNQVRGVNRVVYDITSKPPSTVEWE